MLWMRRHIPDLTYGLRQARRGHIRHPVPVPAAELWRGVSIKFLSSNVNVMINLFRYSERLGIGYQIFLNCSAGALMSTFCLLLCYTVSTATYYRIRPSLFVSHYCQEIKIRKYLTNSFPGDSAEPAVLRSLPRRLDAVDD